MRQFPTAFSQFCVGQLIKGRRGIYKLDRQVHPANENLWFASDEHSKAVVIKSDHPALLGRERDMLQRFHKRPYIRQSIDEAVDPPLLVLEHLDLSVTDASSQQRLSRSEIKSVAWSVLRALSVMHGSNVVHTDIKPQNVLVNLAQGRHRRFSKIALADLGEAVSLRDIKTTAGCEIGAPVFQSPEVILELPWGKPTDIWSFGTMLINLLYGGTWHIFKPLQDPEDNAEIPSEILKMQVRRFGNFPTSYVDFASEKVLGVLAQITQAVTERSPFAQAPNTEIAAEDRDFVCRIMKWDPRDRPTAEELLQDTWFTDEGE